MLWTPRASGILYHFEEKELGTRQACHGLSHSTNMNRTFCNWTVTFMQPTAALSKEVL